MNEKAEKMVSVCFWVVDLCVGLTLKLYLVWYIYFINSASQFWLLYVWHLFLFSLQILGILWRNVFSRFPATLCRDSFGTRQNKQGTLQTNIWLSLVHFDFYLLGATCYSNALVFLLCILNRFLKVSSFSFSFILALLILSYLTLNYQ